VKLQRKNLVASFFDSLVNDPVFLRQSVFSQTHSFVHFLLTDNLSW